jgi:DNA-binding protein H-NS
MAKLTVSEIKRQIAALEAKAAALTEVEMKTSVAKVRSLMESLGVTMEHLGARVARAAKSAKAAVVGKSAPAKKSQAKRAGAGIPKFQDPKTGKTWTGFGKAPAWIASAKNRDKFRIGAADDAAPPAAAASAPAKRALKTTAKKAVAKVATKARAASKKVARKAKAATPAADAPAKKSAAKKAAAKKPAAKKAAAKKAAPRKVASKKMVAPVSTEATSAPEASNSN